jgi:signal transduction histidine kinase/CheY-like chemotaxis protein
MRREISYAVLVSRAVLALLLLGAAFIPQSWIYYKTINFTAFAFLSWLGIARIAKHDLTIGVPLLGIGVLFYPLIAIRLVNPLLISMDIAGAALLLISLTRRPDTDDEGRYPRYPLVAMLYVSALTLVLIIIVANESFRAFVSTGRSVSQSYEFISTVEASVALAQKLESAERDFIITGREATLQEIPIAEDQLDRAIHDIQNHSAAHPGESQRADLLISLLREKIRFVNDVIAVRRTRGFEAAQASVVSGRGSELMRQIRVAAKAIRFDEQRQLDSQHEDEINSAGTARLFLWIGSFASFALLVGLAYLIDRDVTTRRRTAMALQHARDAALQSARLKTDFLANMSHEIRTPMNGIIGMTNLLLETSLTREQKEFAAIVKSNAESLLTIINDILDFSKVEAGKIEIEHMDFDLVSTIEGVIDLLGPAARSKRIDLISSIGSDVPVALHGDPGRLRQVLTNLIANAIKFTDQGEVRVEVHRVPGPGVLLAFLVVDTGIGIPESVRPRLFLSFSQADSSTSRKYGGTGLGLAISKQLIELMGGSIDVESTEGEGSTFWFHLPFEIAQSIVASDEGDTRLIGRSVLVVDDNDTSRRILRHELGKWGLDMAEASSGPDAIELLESTDRPFDVMIVDTEMPDMDGFELAEAVQGFAHHARTPIVLLNSTSRVRSPEELESLGISDQLLKPVRRLTLQRSVARAMGMDPDLVEAPPPPPDIKPQEDTEVERQQVRILLAEDNSVNQKVALRQIEKLGYSAEAVANGHEAVAALERIRYDIVLMDCQMPEMDGFEATGVIRKREGDRAHTVIIAMTANAMEGDRDRCIAAGMDDYLSKPLTKEALGTMLDKWSGILSSREAEH